MMKRYIVSGVILIGLIANNVFAQIPFIQQQDTNKLFLSVDNSSFFKNNEYFNNIKEGYTMIGYFVTPTLTYFPASKTKIEAGIHLLKYSGLDQFSDVLPVFRFQQGLSDHISVVLGTIYGTDNHKLIEPLFKKERYLINNIENGLQFLFDYKYFKSDVWLNWENFILPNDTLQEEFTVGTSSKLMLTQPEKNFQLYFPIQAVVTHKGGQININDKNLQTLANVSVGLCFKYQFANHFFQSMGVENYFVRYKDLSPVKLQAFNQGYGVFTDFVVETANLKLSQGFWYASKFIASRGEELFQSVSYSDSIYKEEMRRLFTTKLVYNKKLSKGISINASLESYYDQRNTNFDYSYGFQLLFNEKFFLKKF